MQGYIGFITSLVLGVKTFTGWKWHAPQLCGAYWGINPYSLFRYSLVLFNQNETLVYNSLIWNGYRHE